MFNKLKPNNLFKIFLFFLVAFWVVSCNVTFSYIGPIEEGYYIQYYPDSTIKSNEYYDNNRKNGIAKYYREDGSLELIGHFENDRPDSIWKSFDNNENIILLGRRKGLNNILRCYRQNIYLRNT